MARPDPPPGRPGPDASAPGRSRRTSRLTSRPAVVLGSLLGSGLVLLAAGRPWVGRVVTGVPGVPRVDAAGTDAAPAVTALALVAAAGAVALALTGPLGRRVVAVLLAFAGVGVAGFTVAVLADPAAALAPALVTATGQSGPVPGGAAAATGWPWAAVLGGLLILLGGALAVVAGGTWGATGRRFESTGTAPPAGPDTAAARRDRNLDAWDALNRGEDPTDGASREEDGAPRE